MNILNELKDKNVLLLQSQFIFFWRLSKDIRKVAKSVHKVNFNGGDFIFYPFGATNYTGKPDGIENFLINFVKKNNIDTVVMFNDCKNIHRIAKTVLEGMVEFYVFEQGYIRPNYITCEKGGVNGYSSLPKDAEFYKNLSVGHVIEPKEVGNVSFYRYLYSVIYFVFFILLKPIFKSSDYSAPDLVKYALKLFKGEILKKFYQIKEKKKIVSFVKNKRQKYYLVPLQMSVDSQIKCHSHYNDIYSFIEEVITSFAKNASSDTYLVFKHHPFDIGFYNYGKYIKELSQKLGVNKRVRYFRTGYIDYFISSSIGVVVINSTSGMNALMFKKPLKVMGNAIYDIDGITYPDSLDNFWKDAETFIPDKSLIEKFVFYVLTTTQINGSFYKKITKQNACGIIFLSD